MGFMGAPKGSQRARLRSDRAKLDSIRGARKHEARAVSHSSAPPSEAAQLNSTTPPAPQAQAQAAQSYPQAGSFAASAALLPVPIPPPVATASFYSYPAFLPIISASPYDYAPSSHPSSAPHLPVQHITEAQLHADDCICTVCICGKHRCPPTPSTMNSTMMIPLSTESNSNFKGIFQPATRVSPPGATLPPARPFQAVSHYKDDYVWHPQLARSGGLTGKELHDTGIGREKIPFSGVSEMRQSYRQHPVHPPPSSKPSSSSLPKQALPDDRDFKSEFSDSFNEKPIPVVSNSMNASSSSSSSLSSSSFPLKIPFEGNSSHKQDYLNWGPHAQPSFMNPRDQLVRSSIPEDRDFQSENRSQYSHKYVQICPAVAVAVKTKKRSGHVYVQRMPPPFTNSFRLK